MSTFLSSLRRQSSGWLAMAALQPKMFLVFRGWVWMELTSRTLGMFIITYFWRAVYENTTTISNLNLQQTINYVLLAQLFASIAMNSAIFWAGWWIRDGSIIIEMLRPIDLQLQVLIQLVANNLTALLTSLPVAILAVIFFGLRLPADPLVWISFAISLALGQLVIFFFDWIYLCLVFYTTEVWGLGVFREGVTLFLSGALIPLQMMPDWLRNIALATPFAQALAMPVSILSGATPLDQVPRVWAGQIAWGIVGFFVSRWLFSIAVRKVTVQGG